MCGLAGSESQQDIDAWSCSLPAHCRHAAGPTRIEGRTPTTTLRPARRRGTETLRIPSPPGHRSTRHEIEPPQGYRPVGHGKRSGLAERYMASPYGDSLEAPAYP